MNITYKCNNCCKFCISNTTKDHLFNLKNPLKIIEQNHECYKFTSNDIFIVNGGEPTISEDFIEIIRFLEKKIITIVYSNGRKLNESIIYDIITTTNTRWVIPFYGMQKTHDFYTNIENSFKETYESISKIPETHKNKINVKFLVKEKQQIKDFFQLLNFLQWKYEIHISLILDHNIKERIKLTRKLKDLINYIFSNQRNLKISNMPLCCLPRNLKRKLDNYIDKNESQIESYYFVDSKRTYSINYDENHNWTKKCNKCKYLNYCVDNSKKYRALKISKDGVFLDLE